MRGTSAIRLTLVGCVAAHGSLDHYPINPALGVSGFPDCVRVHPEQNLSMEQASFDLVCSQRRGTPSAIKIGCVGDSITAGVHSSGGNHTYPRQLQVSPCAKRSAVQCNNALRLSIQLMLDSAHGSGAYAVTNLGACGSTMTKAGDSPFWKRPQFQTLVKNTWDVVTIM
jgi:hypothetical protein